MNPSAPQLPDLAVRTAGLGRRFGERWAGRWLFAREAILI